MWIWKTFGCLYHFFYFSSDTVSVSYKPFTWFKFAAKEQFWKFLNNVYLLGDLNKVSEDSD